MSRLTFPLLTADDIEVRVASVKDNGCALLLYKDARCDRRILNQTVGEFGWQRKHTVLKDVIYCSVGILNPKTNEWIWKEDAGSESNVAKEKGQASDSFKRACFNWGIGEELYATPFIWVPANKTNISGNRVNDSFTVEKIAINSNRQIYGLSILNRQRERVFNFYDKKLDDTIKNKAPSEKDKTENSAAEGKCKVCGKKVSNEHAVKSKNTNNGIIYCTGTCKDKDTPKNKVNYTGDINGDE